MNVIFKEVLYLIMSLEQSPCKLKHADTSATGRERCCDMLLNALLAFIDAWNRYDMGVSEYSSSTTEITYRCLEFMGDSLLSISLSPSALKKFRWWGYHGMAWRLVCELLGRWLSEPWNTIMARSGSHYVNWGHKPIVVDYLEGQLWRMKLDQFWYMEMKRMRSDFSRVLCVAT